MEISLRVVNGLTQRRPSVRIVPAYRPRSCTTRACPGATGVSPAATITPATNTRIPTVISTPLPGPAPAMNNTTPPTTSTNASPAIGHPLSCQATRSVTLGFGISTATSTITSSSRIAQR